MVDVSVLVVCYKSKDLIVQCLDGVFQFTEGCTVEVLVVDCSNDGTKELVAVRFPQVVWVENTKNLGFGRGNNLLASCAKGKVLVLLNPDVIVSDNAIGELWRTAVSIPTAGVVGGWTKLTNGARDPGCRQTIPTLGRLMLETVGAASYLNGALSEDAVQAEDVETVSGAFMLVRAEAWAEIGGFDVSFFMYSEELDLCCRLRKRGWRILMTPRAEVVHLVGSGNSHSPRRTQLLTTAKMHFVRKYWSWPAILMAGSLLWVHALIRVVGAAVGGFAIGRERARKMRESYVGIVFKPANWWRGFNVANEAEKSPV